MLRKCLCVLSTTRCQNDLHLSFSFAGLQHWWRCSITCSNSTFTHWEMKPLSSQRSQWTSFVQVNFTLLGKGYLFPRILKGTVILCTSHLLSSEQTQRPLPAFRKVLSSFAQVTSSYVQRKRKCLAHLQVFHRALSCSVQVSFSHLSTDHAHLPSIL